MAEPDRLTDITVTATAASQAEVDSLKEPYPVPSTGWPSNDNPNSNPKILHYTDHMNTVNLAEQVDQDNEYLFSRGRDWNVVYVTYSPETSGIYKLQLDIPDGCKDADTLMLQDFQVEQTVLTATCTQDGTKTAKCSRCDETKTVTDKGSKLGHNFKDRVCTRCGAWDSQCDNKDKCPTHGYTDVDQDQWYHDFVDYAVSKGVMTGTSTEPLRFEPESTLTRAQMVEALWKLEGKPKGTKAPEFTDVKKDDWFYGSLCWAYSEGLAEGMGDGTFRPNDALTREQMVTFLYRYAKLKGMSVKADAIPETYTDRDQVQEYAQKPFAWAIQTKIVNGMTDTTLEPQGLSKRCQLAKILVQYLKLSD